MYTDSSVDEKSLSDIVNAEKKASEVVINTSDDTEETGLTGEAADAPIRIKPDFDNVQGSMNEVIIHSTSKFTFEDIISIYEYLKSIKIK